jgi:long-subunit acyl-CoA synthetase (AMP-forming)
VIMYTSGSTGLPKVCFIHPAFFCCSVHCIFFPCLLEFR